uniref:Uncharacterized protein n=1 Tax=Alexandrium monilatum TaxID=311494 RepID=A0A7S4W2S0_9DINO|mmetsp:Transcript_21350/g.67197  ORF Transcript_21350/g.67197 Transcript_21350/m.67197 type:complete len:440 (+) Transcript_21350:64-1383(+)
MASPPPLEPQAPGGGPPVLVRNTFLHVDVNRPPTPPSILRASTAPSPKTTGLVKHDGGSGSQSSDEDSSSDGEHVRQCLSDGDAPPLADGSHLEVTRELYEDPEQWEWAKGDAAFVQATTYPPGLPSVDVPRQPGLPSTSFPRYARASSSGAPPVLAALDPGDPARLEMPWSLPLGPPPSGTARKVQIAPLALGLAADGLDLDVDEEDLPMSLPLDPGRRDWRPASQASPAVLDPPREPVAVLPVGSAPAAGSSASSASVEPLLPLLQLAAPAPASRRVPQPQTLTRAFSTSSGYFRVHWTVDARKLRGNDKQAISPPFELPFGDSHPCVPFKLMIFPLFMKDAKTGATFKRSQGRGIVQLKCEADLSEAVAHVRFRISIGSGTTVRTPRGPAWHSFTRGSVCGLPKDLEEWDFRAVVDQESMTFVVCLEVVPQIGDRA